MHTCNHRLFCSLFHACLSPWLDSECFQDRSHSLTVYSPAVSTSIPLNKQEPEKDSMRCNGHAESPGPENIFNRKAVVNWINPYETAVWLLVLYKNVRCCDSASPLAADLTSQAPLLSSPDSDSLTWCKLATTWSSSLLSPSLHCHLSPVLPTYSPPLLVTCSWLDTIFT